MGDVVASQGVGGPDRHLLAEFGQAIARKPPVEDALGVEDLSMAKQVNDRAVSSGHDQVARRRAVALRLLGRHEPSPASSAASRIPSP